MTNSEAIEILKRELEPIDVRNFPEVKQALDTVISAAKELEDWKSGKIVRSANDITETIIFESYLSGVGNE